MKQILEASEGVEVIESTSEMDYATPVTDASGSDPVYVSRIREDLAGRQQINLWITADNVRKGAALNAVQIAELLAKNYL